MQKAITQPRPNDENSSHAIKARFRSMFFIGKANSIFKRVPGLLAKDIKIVMAQQNWQRISKTDIKFNFERCAKIQFCDEKDPDALKCDDDDDR